MYMCEYQNFYNYKIYLYITSAVQEIPNLIQNALFCTKTLNLLFLEKHKCRFAPLLLSFPEQCLWQAAPLRSPPGGEMLHSHMPGLGLLLFTHLKQINSNYYH